MLRKIIKINKEKCNGCGLCAQACHEGAIGMVNGKAELLRDDYCDGLGDCLPVCPTGAIAFEEREAAAYDEAAVKANMLSKNPEVLACGCPGTHSKAIKSEHDNDDTDFLKIKSRLCQWPVQIKLVPVNAPYFNGADLLVAADCTAYAYGSFHNEFMKNKITLIGCPKLDDCDYSEKLSAIISLNTIRSVTVARMEVPCCGGIEHAVRTAVKNSGKVIPFKVLTISTDGMVV